jgi:hypothetical protein
VLLTEISGEVVQDVMFTLANHSPHPEHRSSTLRRVGLQRPGAKARVLRAVAQTGILESEAATRA